MRSLVALIVSAVTARILSEPELFTSEADERVAANADPAFGRLQNVGGIMDMISDLPNLWHKGEGAFDSLTCSKLPTTRDCCINNCAICVGGPLMSMLKSAGKLGDLFDRAGVSSQQLAVGEVCGLPRTYCDQFTKYFDKFPSMLIKALKYVGVNVPHYYESGQCPDGALKNIVASGSFMLIFPVLLFSIMQ